MELYLNSDMIIDVSKISYLKKPDDNNAIKIVVDGYSTWIHNRDMDTACSVYQDLLLAMKDIQNTPEVQPYTITYPEQQQWLWTNSDSGHPIVLEGGNVSFSNKA